MVAASVEHQIAAPRIHLGISGPSGSGKTTLLHVIAGLLRPNQGRVRWGDNDLATMGEGARDAWRRRHVGFVFQDFHLIPELDARANVRLPAGFGTGRAVAAAQADAMLLSMGVPDPRRRAAKLSRGEQQRVAIARALIGAPSVILADEPTASLDGDTGGVVADLLIHSAERSGATLIVVSHDPALLARMQVHWRMAAGMLLAEGAPA